MAFHLVPGQAHELPSAPGLVAKLPATPAWVVANRGYTSDALRSHVRSQGARPAIPARSNEAAVRCPDYIDQNRNRIERMGQAEAMARRGDRLREKHRILSGRPPPRRQLGLDQKLTGLNWSARIQD